jgi:hypothetical protein
VELSEFERLNTERKEAGRKMKQKTVQHKYAKDLHDREAALRAEFEKDKV